MLQVELDPDQFTTRSWGRRNWQREGHRVLMRQRERDAQPIASSRPERLLESLRRLDENHQIELQSSEADAAWREQRIAGGVSGNRIGGPPGPYVPPPEPEGVINTSDHDSRMKRTHGQPTVQGHNAQAAVTEGQLIVAAEITVESPDFGHLEPTVTAARLQLERAGVTERALTVLADAGYWHKEQMESIVSDGIQVLVPPAGGLRKGVRPGWDKGFYAFMRMVLETDYGKAASKRRKATVEPVFAQVKFNRKINRFQRRGRSAALSEWRLIAATHNLLKLVCHER